jgi:VanZ family protein
VTGQSALGGVVWVGTGAGLLALGLWPWLDPEGYRAWQVLAAPLFGPASPRQPLWHRCDAWLHAGMVVALAGWFAVGLRRIGPGWVLLGPVAALACAGIDEGIQAWGGRGRDADYTDLIIDAIAAGTALAVIVADGVLRRRGISGSPPPPPAGAGRPPQSSGPGR